MIGSGGPTTPAHQREDVRTLLVRRPKRKDNPDHLALLSHFAPEAGFEHCPENGPSEGLRRGGADLVHHRDGGGQEPHFCHRPAVPPLGAQHVAAQAREVRAIHPVRATTALTQATRLHRVAQEAVGAH